MASYEAIPTPPMRDRVAVAKELRNKAALKEAFSISGGPKKTSAHANVSSGGQSLWKHWAQKWGIKGCGMQEAHKIAERLWRTRWRLVDSEGRTNPAGRSMKTGDFADVEVVRLVFFTAKFWPEDGANIPNTAIARALAEADPEHRMRGEDQIKNRRTNNFKASAGASRKNKLPGLQFALLYGGYSYQAKAHAQLHRVIAQENHAALVLALCSASEASRKAALEGLRTAGLLDCFGVSTDPTAFPTRALEELVQYAGQQRCWAEQMLGQRITGQSAALQAGQAANHQPFTTQRGRKRSALEAEIGGVGTPIAAGAARAHAQLDRGIMEWPPAAKRPRSARNELVQLPSTPWAPLTPPKRTCMPYDGRPHMAVKENASLTCPSRRQRALPAACSRLFHSYNPNLERTPTASIGSGGLASVPLPKPDQAPVAVQLNIEWGQLPTSDAFAGSPAGEGPESLFCSEVMEQGIAATPELSELHEAAYIDSVKPQARLETVDSFSCLADLYAVQGLADLEGLYAGC